MPQSLQFFSMKSPSLDVEMSFEHTLRLGKEISDVTLSYDNTLFFIKRLNVLQALMKHSYMSLQNYRGFAAMQEATLQQVYAQQSLQFYNFLSLATFLNAELLQIQLRLLQSCHVHQIMQSIGKLSLEFFSTLQNYADNSDVFRSSITKYHCSLKHALDAMNENTPITTSLSAIVLYIDWLLTIPEETTIESRRALLFQIPQTLINLFIQSYTRVNYEYFMMNIAIGANNMFRAYFSNFELRLSTLGVTVFFQRNTIELLSLMIDNTQRDLAFVEQQLFSHHQIANTLLIHKVKSLDKFKMVHEMHSLQQHHLFRKNPAYRQIINDLKPIYIQDIVVTHSSTLAQLDSGEVRGPIEEKAVVLKKIINQIKLLADLANKHHQKNCDTAGRIKKDCENNVTRLITDEFSFYPTEPLTIKRYMSILREIYRVAKTLSLNLQLILASFPVLDTEKKLHNVILHVTCGPKPILHHHSKAFPAPLDFNYGYPLASTSSPWLTPQMALICFDKPLVFSFGGILHSKTASGARFICNIEICLEHNFHLGVRSLHAEITKSPSDSKTLPMQYSHVLSSRTTFIMGMESHNVQITQADAFKPGIWTRDSRLNTYDSHFPLEIFSLEGYFGTARRVHIFKPQPVTYLPGKMLAMAFNENLRTIKETLEVDEDLVAPLPGRRP